MRGRGGSRPLFHARISRCRERAPRQQYERANRRTVAGDAPGRFRKSAVGYTNLARLVLDFRV